MIDRHPPLLRLWHWLNLLAISGMAATGFLRLTFLNKRSNGEIILRKLEALHLSITPEQAISVAKAIRSPMWEWHYVFAVLLGITILIRFLAMGTGQARLPLLKLLHAENMELRFKHLIHLLICASIFVMALTGTLYYFHDALGIAKSSVKWAEELHSLLFAPLMILIALHIAGVVKFELDTRKSIVSKMIHGDR